MYDAYGNPAGSDRPSVDPAHLVDTAANGVLDATLPTPAQFAEMMAAAAADISPGSIVADRFAVHDVHEVDGDTGVLAVVFVDSKTGRKHVVLGGGFDGLGVHARASSAATQEMLGRLGGDDYVQKLHRGIVRVLQLVSEEGPVDGSVAAYGIAGTVVAHSSRLAGISRVVFNAPGISDDRIRSIPDDQLVIVGEGGPEHPWAQAWRAGESFVPAQVLLVDPASGIYVPGSGGIAGDQAGLRDMTWQALGQASASIDEARWDREARRAPFRPSDSSYVPESRTGPDGGREDTYRDGDYASHGARDPTYVPVVVREYIPYPVHSGAVAGAGEGPAVEDTVAPVAPVAPVARVAPRPRADEAESARPATITFSMGVGEADYDKASFYHVFSVSNKDGSVTVALVPKGRLTDGQVLYTTQFKYDAAESARTGGTVVRSARTTFGTLAAHWNAGNAQYHGTTYRSLKQLSGSGTLALNGLTGLRDASKNLEHFAQYMVFAMGLPAGTKIDDELRAVLVDKLVPLAVVATHARESAIREAARTQLEMILSRAPTEVHERLARFSGEALKSSLVGLPDEKLKPLVARSKQYLQALLAARQAPAMEAVRDASGKLVALDTGTLSAQEKVQLGKLQRQLKDMYGTTVRELSDVEVNALVLAVQTGLTVDDAAALKHAEAVFYQAAAARTKGLASDAAEKLRRAAVDKALPRVASLFRDLAQQQRSRASMSAATGAAPISKADVPDVASLRTGLEQGELDQALKDRAEADSARAEADVASAPTPAGGAGVEEAASAAPADGANAAAAGDAAGAATEGGARQVLSKVTTRLDQIATAYGYLSQLAHLDTNPFSVGNMSVMTAKLARMVLAA